MSLRINNTTPAPTADMLNQLRNIVKGLISVRPRIRGSYLNFSVRAVWEAIYRGLSGSTPEYWGLEGFRINMVQPGEEYYDDFGCRLILDSPGGQPVPPPPENDVWVIDEAVTTPWINNHRIGCRTETYGPGGLYDDIVMTVEIDGLAQPFTISSINDFSLQTVNNATCKLTIGTLVNHKFDRVAPDLTEYHTTETTNTNISLIMLGENKDGVITVLGATPNFECSSDTEIDVDITNLAQIQLSKVGDNNGYIAYYILPAPEGLTGEFACSQNNLASLIDMRNNYAYTDTQLRDFGSGIYLTNIHDRYLTFSEFTISDINIDDFQLENAEAIMPGFNMPPFPFPSELS